MFVGIVGNEAAKFTAHGQEEARRLIRELLHDPASILVSGHCHLGGIDIWAEEEAEKLGRDKVIFPPKAHNWSTGYKPRNIQIARQSEVVHNIVVNTYPPNFKGMRFKHCYHCDATDHVKSGGCWTALYAENLGKLAKWHIIQN